MYTFEEFCECISQDGFDNEQFITLSSVFGKTMRKKLVTINNCTDASFLQTLNAADQLENIDKSVLAFLNALAVNGTDKKVKTLNAYEHLVSLALNNYIGALNFALNLISYFISGSRNIVELRSRYSPAGSYSFVMGYLNRNTQKSLETPANNDITVAFDNNQIMARNWNVQNNSKAFISVITTMICLVPPQITNLQKDPLLKPSVWLNSIDIKEAGDAEKDRIFRIERNKYIIYAIQTITEEIERENAAPEPKKNKIDSKNDPYDYVESHVTGKNEVKILDPIMVNPCSYLSLESVLDDILAKCNMEWVVIVCDVLSFVLCSKMIDNCNICPTCQELFKKNEAFLNHVKVHPVDDISKYRKYGNILLLPGLGHVEINATKAIFKLLWRVVLKDLAVMLGWKSIKALTACEKCTNHHKSWQILQILFGAGTKAILKPYIVQCKNENNTPSVAGLYKYFAKLYIYV